MANSMKKNYEAFLFFFVLSLIGNSSADYAVLWEAVARSDGKTSTDILQAFFISQSLGTIFLAPLLAIWIDRVTKLRAAIILDISYAILLAVVAFFVRLHGLSVLLALVFGFFSAGVGMAHRAGIAGIVVRQASEVTGANSAMAKYTAALSYVALVGSVASGLLFKMVGFSGTLMVSVFSFAPILVFYPRIFHSGNEDGRAEPWSGAWESFRSAFKFYIRDSEVLRVMLCIGILNIGSSLFPAVVAIVVNAKFPGRSDYSAVLIGFSILMSTVLLGRISPVVDSMKANLVIGISVLPVVLLLGLGVLMNEPWFFVFAFTVGCIGASVRNVFGGILRISRVPKNMVARVTTFNISLIQLGQVLGAIFIIPSMDGKLDRSVAFMIGSALLASVVSFIFVSKLSVYRLKNVEPNV